MDLREHWEKPDCPAQSSITALKELIGLPVTINFDTAILWAELEKHHRDQSTFIPSITNVIKAWCDTLASLLQDDANADWTEQFLDLLNDNGKRLQARVEAKPSTKVSTTLAKPTFLINIPQTAPPYLPYRGAPAYFTADFQSLFSHPPTATSTSPEDDDWASVALPTRQPQAQQSASTNPASTTTELPTLDRLPRPELLFQSQTPYHLIVKIVHNAIHIYSSHQPSLELLSAYLTKYARNIDNPGIRQPIVRCELQASFWGYGALYDCLVVKPGDVRGSARWEDINPVLVLAFVEGVLGYRAVGEEEGGARECWYFKREVGFR